MSTTTIRDLLADHRFFAGLPPADLDLIAGCGVNVAFRAGAMVAREGDPADRFFVVREGHGAIEVHAPGRGALVVATAGPGDVIGWSWLFPPHQWRFDVRAVTDVRAVALDGACLRGKADEDPALGYRLMERFARILVSRLESTRLQLADLYGTGEAAGVP